MMNKINLQFPVMHFDSVWKLTNLKADWKTLTTASRSAVKRGFYNGLFIVDITGQGVRVKQATIIQSGWFMWVFNLVLDRARVDLVFDGTPFPVPLDEVKARVIRYLRKSGGEVIGGYGDLRRQVQAAQSMKEIMRLMVTGRIVHEPWCGKGLRQMLDLPPADPSN